MVLTNWKKIGLVQASNQKLPTLIQSVPVFVADELKAMKLNAKIRAVGATDKQGNVMKSRRSLITSVSSLMTKKNKALQYVGIDPVIKVASRSRFYKRIRRYQ